MNPLQKLAADRRATASPSPPAAPDPYRPPAAVAIDLVKRIPGHHGDISRIEIREPTFGDYVECGPIVRNVWSDDAERPGKPRMESIENPAAIMKWAVALTGIPESVLRLLGWKDARAVMGEVFAIVQELEKGNSQAGPTTSSSRSG